MIVINKLNQAIIVVFVEMAYKHIVDMNLLAFIKIVFVLPLIQVPAQVIARTAIDNYFQAFSIISAYLNQTGISLSAVEIKAF
jgi:hypothetical protein